MKLIMVGFGGVGQALARLLHDKRDQLHTQHGFTATIVSVITGTRGTLYHPDGLDIEELLQAIEAGHLHHYPAHDSLIRDWDVLHIIGEGHADTIVEVSPTNTDTGQPALKYFEAAIDNGKHIVTANKGPLAVNGHALLARMTANNLHLKYEATVMAGTPAIDVGLGLRDSACGITEIRGILNGTTNYILTRMESGMDYDEALTQAQQLGYAETDPAGDVEGWDAAAKVAILAFTFFDMALHPRDMQVQGITHITVADVEAARAAGERWKLIAQVSAVGGSVQPMRVPVSDPLAGVSGATNAITFTTQLMGAITLMGAGAGQVETAFALLSDLLSIHRTIWPHH